jgi:hypothetical protein
MLDQNTSTKDIPDNVVALPTQQFNDEQALAWLRERGCITAPASHLARVWGWHERRARRKLDSWKLAGLIRRKGKSITVVAAKSDTPISVKRTANGHAQTEQVDAGRATSDTNVNLKSDTPTLVSRTGRSKPPLKRGSRSCLLRGHHWSRCRRLRSRTDLYPTWATMTPALT